MTENRRDDKEPMPEKYDYEQHLSRDEIDQTHRASGRSPESEARLEKVIDAYVRAVRQAIYAEADAAFDDGGTPAQLADLAWEDGWRHGTEFAQAALAGRRPVLNPSLPISQTRLAEIVKKAYPYFGVTNPSRLKSDYLLSGTIAFHEYGTRRNGGNAKLVLDLDDVAKEWPRLIDHEQLWP